MMKKLISAAALGLLAALPVSAATVTGSFNVKVVNQTGLNFDQSKATIANFNTYYGLGTDGVNKDAFTYTGDMDFGNAADTIAAWLDTATGVVSGLDAVVGALTLSMPNIYAGTATSSFFLFEGVGYFDPADFSILHDDGIAVYDDGVRIGGNDGPTPAITSLVNGFTGGKFSLLYVATNGNPSILNATFTPSPVPLPAAGFLLIGAIGGLAALRRRKTA
jgi:hypothetical protein